MALLPWRDDRTLLSLQSDVEAGKKAISQLEDRAIELETKKDNSLSVAWVGVAGLVAGSIISGGVAVYTDDNPLPEPAPVVQCIEERQKAKELYITDGYWTPLPESSEIERQCNVNTYIVGPPPDDDGGGSSGSFERDPSGSDGGF